MKYKLLTVMMAMLLVLTACAQEGPVEEVEPEVVIQAKAGDYQMLSPFKISPLRQIHAIGFRENDVTEIGRRLLEKSKEHFNIKKYHISEGQVIDVDRYYDLVMFKSDTNPEGLMTKYESLDIDGVTLQKPIFVSDLFEFNFFKPGDSETVEGISVALVLKRLQYIDQQTGTMHTLSDEALFNVGQTIGLQLSAYLRSLERMSDVPIYIALYAQASDMDKLPDNYLPGYFIGDGFSTDRAIQFKSNQEQWIMLSDTQAAEQLPQVESSFSQLKRKVMTFMGDESVGIIGKAFVVENKLDTIRLDINAPAKSYLELHGLGQYVSQEIEQLGGFGVPVKVNISVQGKTRITIVKNPNNPPEVTVFE